MTLKKWIATVTGARAQRLQEIRTERVRSRAMAKLMALYINADTYTEARRTLEMIMLLH